VHAGLLSRRLAGLVIVFYGLKEAHSIFTVGH